MEWDPINKEAAHKHTSRMMSVGTGGVFTIEQENVLLRCFSLFDLDDDGKLSNEDIEHVSI